jgi:hypothetical protein
VLTKIDLMDKGTDAVDVSSYIITQKCFTTVDILMNDLVLSLLCDV